MSIIKSIALPCVLGGKPRRENTTAVKIVLEAMAKSFTVSPVTRCDRRQGSGELGLAQRFIFLKEVHISAIQIVAYRPGLIDPWCLHEQ